MASSYSFSPKDPNELLPYAIDWTRHLAPGDVLASSTWSVPGGLTVVGGLTSFTPTGSSIVLSGGTAETDYDLVCTATTVAGYRLERTVTLPVREL